MSLELHCERRIKEYYHKNGNPPAETVFDSSQNNCNPVSPRKGPNSKLKMYEYWENLPKGNNDSLRLP